MPLLRDMPMVRDLPKPRSGAGTMYRTLIRHNDPNLVDKLMAQLMPMFRTWVMHEAERIGRMPLLDPADKARVVHAVQQKLGRVDAKTGEIAQRLILLLVLNEAEKVRAQGQQTEEPHASPELARAIQAEQNAIHTIARMHEDLYDDALGIVENLKA